MRLGATPKNNGQTQFVVWAPNADTVNIEVVGDNNTRHPLKRGERGYFTGTLPVAAGTRYFVVPGNGHGRPDPASRFQPEGVHGPSEVVDASFDWSDAQWRGLPLNEYVIYELHIGTFSAEGTFDGAIQHLDELQDLGITAIEIMPVAQFPGHRNWGYDGVLPFAVQNTYGGPAGFKRLVDACHARGIAVVLDVVYNHLGPEGNYLGEFAPYFIDKYKTPWGPAINVDEAHSDEVRRYFIDNALEWITDYHIDALRLDAVHGILDTSAKPFLAELAEVIAQRAKKLDRQVFLIAESDLNDVRMISPVSDRGFGMHSQWADDFHHSLHALLTREDSGYYADYGSIADLAESLRTAYVYKGDYSEYRRRRHGNDPAGARDEQFVICIQNHDQVGNRVAGERISVLTDFERQKLGAAVTLLSPFVPLLFMGEEYAETQPFPYFIDHSDKKLIAAVRKGRKEEFAGFAWKTEPPDPASAETFESARMRRPQDGEHAAMRRFYKRLLQVRKEFRLGAGAQSGRRIVVHDEAEAITIVSPVVAIVFGFSNDRREIRWSLPNGEWRRQLSSHDKCWNGVGDDSPEQVTGGEMALTLSGPTARLYTRAG